MKTLLLALALLVTGPAWADWLLVTESNDHYEYIDATTIRRDRNLRKVWELQDLKLRHKDGEMSRRYRSEYDCKEIRFRFLSVTSFADSMGRGKVTAMETAQSPGWTDIAPNTIAETTLKFVCSR